MPDYLETDDFIADFLRGDQRAFTAVYNEYYSRIYVFAVKLILDKEEAKDLTIDTFRKLFTKNKDFDNLPNMKAFLYITVRNTCLNYLRYLRQQSKQQKELLLDLENDRKLENKPIEGQVIQALYKALERLPPKSGRIVQMIYLEGLKYEEVGKLLNISLATVKSQRKYALDLLKEYLSEKHMIAICLLCLVPISRCIK
ncbi:MAG TPA: sigma-70 family RNA polymerase sigma factor [Puia sp.]